MGGNRQIFWRIKQPPSQYAATLGWRSITLLHFACLRRQSGQKLGNPVLVNLAQARCALQYPHQIAVCIQTTFLSRFNQAVDHGTGLCAGRSIGKKQTYKRSCPLALLPSGLRHHLLICCLMNTRRHPAHILHRKRENYTAKTHFTIIPRLCIKLCKIISM